MLYNRRLNNWYRSQETAEFRLYKIIEGLLPAVDYLDYNNDEVGKELSSILSLTTINNRKYPKCIT
jgi:hypothetical protein